MKFLTSIVLAITLTSVCGRNLLNTEELGSRIVNGKTAPNGAFPYMASLRVGRSHSCGGAIINDRWILTAGHCAFSGLTAFVGTNNINSGGVPYTVQSVHVNPNYKGGPTYANDIALLKVAKSIQFNNLVQPIPLATTNLKDKQKAVLSGWGYTVPGGITPNALQYFNVTLLTSQTCEKGIPITLDKSQICAQGTRTQGACHGDSGSPLVSNGTVVGVTSRLVVVPCANGYPDIYTDVNLFSNWISDTLKKF